MIAHRDDDLIDQGTAMNCIELVLAMLLAVVAKQLRGAYFAAADTAAAAAGPNRHGRGTCRRARSWHGARPANFLSAVSAATAVSRRWRIPKDGLLRDKTMILELALGLVVFTVLGAGSSFTG